MNFIVSPRVSEVVPKMLLSFVFKIVPLYKKKYKTEKCKHIFEFTIAYSKGIPYQELIHRVGNTYYKKYSFGKKLSQELYEGCIIVYDTGQETILVTIDNKDVAI